MCSERPHRRPGGRTEHHGRGFQSHVLYHRSGWGGGRSVHGKGERMRLRIKGLAWRGGLQCSAVPCSAARAVPCSAVQCSAVPCHAALGTNGNPNEINKCLAQSNTSMTTVSSIAALFAILTAHRALFAILTAHRCLQIAQPACASTAASCSPSRADTYRSNSTRYRLQEASTTNTSSLRSHPLASGRLRKKSRASNCCRGDEWCCGQARHSASFRIDRRHRPVALQILH